MGLTISQLREVVPSDVSHGGGKLKHVASALTKAAAGMTTHAVGGIHGWHSPARANAILAGSDISGGAKKMATGLSGMGTALDTFGGKLSDAKATLKQAQAKCDAHDLTISDDGSVTAPPPADPRFPTRNDFARADAARAAEKLAKKALHDADHADSVCAKSLREAPDALAISMGMYRDGAIKKFAGFMPKSVAMALHPTGRRTPESCAEYLNCTVADFDQMTVAQREQFYKEFKDRWALRLGAPNGWENISGVLKFFGDTKQGKSGGWVSIVDASILQGLQTGTAMTEGRTTDSQGNPGSGKWKTYLDHMRQGDYYKSWEASRHDWGVAEQAATDYGTQVAAQYGKKATLQQQFFFQPSQAYRATLRNLPEVENGARIAGAIVGPVGIVGAYVFNEGTLKWATDPGNEKLTHHGADFAYGTGQVVDGFLHPIERRTSEDGEQFGSGAEEALVGSGRAAVNGAKTVGDAAVGTWHELFG